MTSTGGFASGSMIGNVEVTSTILASDLINGTNTVRICASSLAGVASEITSSISRDDVVPTVTTVTPINTSLNVPVNTTISITLSKTIQLATVTTNSIDTTCSGSIQISSSSIFTSCVQMRANILSSNLDRTFQVKSANILVANTIYYIRVTSAMKDLINNPVTVNNTSFTTESFSTTELYAFYPFNGNTNDSSGNARHATADGAALTIDRFGVTDQAYTFNGISNNILTPSSFSLGGGSSSFSLSMWIKPTALSNQIILGMSNSLSVDSFSVCWAYSLNMSATGALNFKVYNSSDGGVIFTGLTGSSNITANLWQHITVVYSSTGSATIFINGTAGTSVARSGSTWRTTSLALRIGRGCIDAQAGGVWHFSGAIDEVRIYKKALTVAEVQALANDK